jgi:hypothetical protein
MDAVQNWWRETPRAIALRWYRFRSRFAWHGPKHPLQRTLGDIGRLVELRCPIRDSWPIVASQESHISTIPCAIRI